MYSTEKMYNPMRNMSQSYESTVMQIVFPDSSWKLLDMCARTCFKCVPNHTSVRRAQINQLIALWLNLQSVGLSAFELSLQPFSRHQHINLMKCLHFIWRFGSEGIILGLNPRVELQFRSETVTASNSFPSLSLYLSLSHCLFETIKFQPDKLAAFNLVC